jgi:2,5-furandicarboxylate decarboxylase 1
VSHVNLIFGKYAARGERMPFAVTIGHHPIFYIGAESFIPYDEDEYEVIGGLMKQPLELVKCRTNDIYAPAFAEIVLEGYIDPSEEHTEAPFGEFSYVYGPAAMQKVLTVTAVTMRKDPVYIANFAGHPDHLLLGGTGRLSSIFNAVKKACPTVQDVYMPTSGCSRYSCYVSIKKRHEGEAKNACMAVFSTDQMIKYAIVVDDDVNIFDDGAVLKAISTRLRPPGNCFVIENAKGTDIDPTAHDGLLVTKVGIDCTKPLSGWPNSLSVPGVDELNLDDWISR